MPTRLLHPSALGGPDLLSRSPSFQHPRPLPGKLLHLFEVTG